VIKLENVSKSYRLKNRQIDALKNINLEINPGEFLVIRGPSGSGKTTLLLALGGMLCPSRGKIWVDGQDLYALSQSDRNRFRAQNIGFVFQMFHLLPYLNVLENILLPVGSQNSKATRESAVALLKKMGLADRETHKPASLSAGERQRTAIARALINHPKIILADEPTGNLDPENARAIIQHLAEFQQAGGTVVVVTHGTAAERFANRIFVLRDGQLTD
jgi:ABC-type lipoprotein export system ATPase subunit